MEDSQSRQEHKKSMAMAWKVPQLLTPEEHLEDNFPSKAPVQTFQAAVPSPPASPEFRSFSTEARYQPNDDVLYPESNCTNNPNAQRPLFESAQRFSTPDRQHTPPTEPSLSAATPSTQHDSPLEKAAEPSESQQTGSSDKLKKEPVGPVALVNHYGLDYWRFCVMEAEQWRARKMAERKLPPPTSLRRAARDGYTEKVISSLGRPYRVEKSIATGQTSTRPKMSRTTLPKASARSITPSAAVVKHESPVTKRSRRQASTPDVSSGAGFPNTVQPKPRTRAAPTKKIDDATDWRQIPDFCPPLSTLDESSRQLSVHWTNNNELNLSDDPDRAELHPQELKLAATLRLKCNSYLANKRRIFKGKVDHLREGKDFNKTSAQTVTNIDVNKASRLWTAFDQAGWFNEELFKQHL